MVNSLSLGSRALAVTRSNAWAAQITRFVVHFVEMAIAMLVGMAALGPGESVLGLADRINSSPEASAFAMTCSMVFPMAGWMLIRRHGWQHAWEMSVAMAVPTFLLIAGSLLGLLPHSAPAIGMNYLMWLGMLGAMLFRWRSYAQHGGHDHR